MPQNQNKDPLNIEEILKILPHRYPFLLVDKVVEIEKGKRIVAVKNVTYNEPFFQGHFPVLRVMPGVLVLEALGQTGGILLNFSLPEPDKVLIFLSKIDNAKFRRPVVPGDQLHLEVNLIKLKNSFGYVKGMAYVDGEVVAECELMASFRNIEDRDE
jgi:3-hydroxyacyl-[acyl-carrier-protein] dehydratase/UDP-3-O-[3-hydroxymyristoyl] N-acetylglucosamine deacetylase/3-hydroxyacyl-[acyl-carrier-protein] dehydratase